MENAEDIRESPKIMQVPLLLTLLGSWPRRACEPQQACPLRRARPNSIENSPREDALVNILTESAKCEHRGFIANQHSDRNESAQMCPSHAADLDAVETCDSNYASQVSAIFKRSNHQSRVRGGIWTPSCSDVPSKSRMIWAPRFQSTSDVRH